MNKRAKLTSKGRSARYFALPWSIIKDPRYKNLSAMANTLLIDLGAQYDGFNNGHLVATKKFMFDKRGWKSEESLNKAKQELIAEGLIMVTRCGGKNRPTLYAFTFNSIDEKPKTRLHVKPTRIAPGAWKKPHEYEDASLNAMFH